MSRFTHAIVRPPARNFARGLTTAALGAPDHALALAQHAAYVRALEGCGLRVAALPEDPRFPDSTFVEDTAVLTAHLAVLSRPGAASRAGEVDAIRGAVRSSFARVAAIAEPGTHDGGDICEAGDTVFLGVSHRTNEEGARQRASLLDDEGYATRVVDVRTTPGILHLKSGIAWLGARRLAVIPALATHPAFAGWELLVVPEGEEYAANAVLVNGRLLVASGFPRFESLVRGAGLEILPLGMSEYRKMDGGLSCLSLRW